MSSKLPLVVSRAGDADSNRYEGDMKDNEDALAEPSLKLWHKLGWYFIVALPLCFIFTIAAIAFLWFLWTGDTRNNTWSAIMVNSWATRTVALISLILRTATSIQAGACTSMMAAVILENGLFVLSKAAAVSTLRYVNGGPESLLKLFLGRVGIRRKISVAAFVLALFCTTTISQFTSTLLLSDLKAGLVPGEFTTQQIPMPFQWSVNYSARSVGDFGFKRDIDTSLLWGTRPISYPTFAEYSEPPTMKDGVRDTGVTVRALFPITSEANRSSLRNYTGWAAVFNSQVTCIRPSINLTSLNTYEGFANMTLGNVTGNVGPTAELAGLAGISPFNTKVSCTFGLNTRSREWATIMCPVNLQGARANLFHDTSGPDKGEQQSLSYLIINATGTEQDWQLTNERNGQWTFMDEDEWLVIEPNSKDIEWKLHLSLCYTNPQPIAMEVETYSSKSRTEPQVDWDRTIQDFNTLDVRKQLGATIPKESPEVRGIMYLKQRNWSYNASPNYSLGKEWDVYDPAIIPLCSDCTDLGDESLNQYQQILLQHIFRNTRDPTLLVQAWITMQLQITYYYGIYASDLLVPANVQQFVSVLVPQQNTGLIIVSCVIGLHLILVIGNIVLFRCFTSYSRLGNAWQSVIQVFSPATEEIYAKGLGMSDTEIEKLTRGIAGGYGQQWT
jgi:hypothetical protein